MVREGEVKGSEGGVRGSRGKDGERVGSLIREREMM